MHIGPIAQDFYKAFGLGGIDGNRAISTIDPAGVALLGIQALSKLTNSVKDGAMIFGDPVDLNLQNKNIVEIASLVSSSGNWSLDNDGNLKVSEIKANKLCLGSTCIDEDTLKAILKSSGLMPTEASHSTPPSSDTLNDSTSSLSVNTDTEAPVITLNGDASSTLNVGDSFVDQGATVTDNVDHNLGVTVSGSVDTNTSGVYSLYYDATDNAGNKAEQKVRVITIK
ncbi:MAG: DUF5011 domain-containing protein [Candidatus Vogelbacteria bacterium]|nr:DUF5011 domain-containing protein [Candidatus Vogelbacteria bacterium]